MTAFDLTKTSGRLRAYLDFLWNDHGYVRLAFQNAHWISPELARSNQPWPFQLGRWKREGVRTVINLRGGFGGSFHALESRACERLGLKLVYFTVTSRDPPTAEQVLTARDLFDAIDYPAVMHCKSGADRAGMMSVLYAHLRLGQPIREARKQLSLRYMHLRDGRTGVLDYVFDHYLTEGEPRGLSFVDWIQTPAYDPTKIKADFRPTRWHGVLTDWLLRRE